MFDRNRPDNNNRRHRLCSIEHYVIGILLDRIHRYRYWSLTMNYHRRYKHDCVV
jgi:hypothetical protein